MIYTEGQSHFHFLHSDSIGPLGLAATTTPRKQYITAEVVEKEYCQVAILSISFKGFLHEQ
jgi:hypothetical protein